ncbi:MAG: hypothetical protein V9G19_27860 [Tetrasphaera sp.]
MDDVAKTGDIRAESAFRHDVSRRARASFARRRRFTRDEKTLIKLRAFLGAKLPR